MNRFRIVTCGLAVGLGVMVVPSPTEATTSPASGLLYSQIANEDDLPIVSTSFDGTDQRRPGSTSAAADDFTVPAGQTWTIDGVKAVGYHGAGDLLVDVVFYADNGGLPGAVVSSNQVSRDGRGPIFRLTLPTPATLSAGTYWLSVQAVGTKFWYWYSTTDLHGNPTAWENPQDGYHTGCTAWTVLSQCFSAPGEGPDRMFTLRGAVD